MEQLVDCIIAGGTEHGRVRRKIWNIHSPALPVLATRDGHFCQVAAKRVREDEISCYILLHPLATGEQFTALLLSLTGHSGSPSDLHPGCSGRFASAV